MSTAFHRALRKTIIELFSCDELAPAEVAKKLSRGMVRPCEKKASSEIDKIIRDRGVTRLVHFTPLENVRHICQFGLIPREYLSLEVMQMALSPRFTDHYRMESKQDYNCLSITDANYRMFYSKREAMPEKRWCVIEYSSELLLRLWAEYCPTNAASKASITPGVEGLQNQFMLEDLRRDLNLKPNQTTDPQAEVLCDSVIGPHYIKRVCVNSEEDVASLQRHGIRSEIDGYYFQPRSDFNFWRGKKITDLEAFQEYMRKTERE